ncbi:MAG: aminopeptidase, partial [Halobacteriales archaeon]|nr:aminopeptidase [Halobacteriales archaeon]
QHPTPAFAQEAGMSLAGYREFVYDAMVRDWGAIDDEQERLRERVAAADELRIVAGETDVSMSVEGMVVHSDDARYNLPGGEVFTAPVVDSVEGEAVFDLPVIAQGTEIEDAHLVFENGEVVEYDARTNADVLGGLLETDEGASRVGEVGIGTNGAIDRFTRNILFDEKLSGTVHLALGFAYPVTVGEDREVNESSIHLDMLIDTSEGRIELDGEPVQEHGEFVFEEEHLTP